jgi:putative endonuclease
VAQRARINDFGKAAERFAAKFLSSKGYKIIGRNFRSKFGEIDLIALKEGALIFIEVKARRSLRFGMPQEAVTGAKINKIIKTGEFYIQNHPDVPERVRIEVLSLFFDDNGVNDAVIIPVD